MNTPSYKISEVENGFILQIEAEINYGEPSQYKRFYVFSDLKKTFDFISAYWNDDLKQRAEDEANPGSERKQE